VGHGRQETRTYVVFPAPETVNPDGVWRDLSAVGMAITESADRQGRSRLEVRYYILSVLLAAQRFARAVRGHWSIENSCHRSLDVTYREDESRIRERQLRENFAWLNRMSLSLLKQHLGRQSIAMKRRRCGWSEGFLMELACSPFLVVTQGS
jgi:predicted transposase YbfD/YdcC